MKLDEVIFIDSYPKLDLHGYDADSAEVLVIDFIKDSYVQGYEIVNIVHGIGKGILKKRVAEVLAKNKLVVAFKTFYNNNGCTLVQVIKR